jgi:putative endonuclease
VSNNSLRSLRGFKARATGRAGEDQAVSFLESRGFQIIKRNFSCRFGEIDIIAREGDELVFVEVKNFRQSGLIHPLEAITRSKREKLTLAALSYLQEGTGCPGSFRFDLVAVCHDRDDRIVSAELFKKIF